MIMPKQIFRTLELTTLLVAFDHLEEYGPPAALAARPFTDRSNA